ncbi:MAG: hypothetical protein HZC22_17055 [Rhodocyclales bacterium]|nr:hypothetical protein [Rhodocyclales bacterium]
MGIMGGVGQALSGIAQQNQHQWDEESTLRMRSEMEEQKQLRVMEAQDALKRRDGKAVGGMVAEYLDRDLPITAAPAKVVTGEETGTDTPGLVGEVGRLRAWLQSNTDISPEDRKAALAQLDEQEATANRAAQAAVDGQTRKPTLREAAQYAETEALKRGIPSAELERLDRIAHPKPVTIGADSAVLTEGPDGRLAVAYENRMGIDRQLARDDRADVRSADREDRRDERLQTRLDAMDQRRSGLTLPQQVHDKEVDVARAYVSQYTPEEIKLRTAKATNTGRENPDYDPGLANRVRLANRRKYGADDWFDTQINPTETRTDSAPPVGGDVSARFADDQAMTGKGYRLGRQTPRGREVVNANGEIIGHYN